jgi:hypothetical protein
MKCQRIRAKDRVNRVRMKNNRDQVKIIAISLFSLLMDLERRD